MDLENPSTYGLKQSITNKLVHGDPTVQLTHQSVGPGFNDPLESVIQIPKNLVDASGINIDAQLEYVQKEAGEGASNEDDHDKLGNAEKIPFMFSNTRHARRGMKWVRYWHPLYQLPQEINDLLQKEKQSMKRGASHSSLEGTQRRVRARYSSLYPTVGPYVSEKPWEELVEEEEEALEEEPVGEEESFEELYKDEYQEEEEEEEEPMEEEESFEEELSEEYQEEEEEEEPVEDEEQLEEEDPLEEEEQLEDEPIEEEHSEEWTEQDLLEEPLEDEEALSYTNGSFDRPMDDEVIEEEYVDNLLYEEELMEDELTEEESVEEEPVEEEPTEDQSVSSTSTSS